MIGFKETIEFFGKAVRLGVLFEVIVDPEDESDFIEHIKAIDVWLRAVKEKLDPDQVTIEMFREKGHCVRNITKLTPRELRQYTIMTFDEGFLYVIAVPTTEWEKHYKPRSYAPVPIKYGRSYNFTVSVPSK